VERMRTPGRRHSEAGDEVPAVVQLGEGKGR
jgi:hypothetical protein